MVLDFKKLENIKQKDGKTIARCPACAALGRDKKGEHLYINDDGRFGCIAYQGSTGALHRSRIYQLLANGFNKTIVRPAKGNNRIGVIKADIFGTLGTGNLKSRTGLNNKNLIININNNLKKGVPNVPSQFVVDNEAFEERAAIIEYEGNIPREIAERLAWEMINS
ncbi:MAG: hypothetical protein P9M03_03555 [Candidatus Theseobacter exili]|nr:hypothetical protein [Candidatus Theseobacter exili]